MPPKILKMRGSGKEIVIKSWLLPNGRLLILQKRPKPNQRELEYREVEPGTSDYKYWYNVHVVVPRDEPDPRV